VRELVQRIFASHLQQILYNLAAKQKKMMIIAGALLNKQLKLMMTWHCAELQKTTY
jgi:hypothetical protein